MDIVVGRHKLWIDMTMEGEWYVVDEGPVNAKYEAGVTFEHYWEAEDHLRDVAVVLEFGTIN